MSAQPGQGTGPSRRRVLGGVAGLVGLGGTGWSAALAAGAASAAAAPALPAALSRPALISPKAQATAQLAVARAGQRLVAVGERGTALWSDDHGRTWHQAQVPVQCTLTCVQFVSDTLGWAGGHAGVLLNTRDGGQSWQLQLHGVQAAQRVLQAAQARGDARAVAQAEQLLAEGADKPWLDLSFVDARRGYLVGAYNLFLATDDGGQTWRSLGHALPNPRGLHLYGLRAVGQHLVLVGEQGLLLRAGGLGAEPFEAVHSPYKGSFFGVVDAAPGVAVAYGLRGMAYRSTDGGAQWQRVETDTPVSISAAAALPQGHYVLASQAGALMLGHALQGGPARTVSHSPVPVTGAVATADGALVVSTLRGVRRVGLRSA